MDSLYFQGLDFGKAGFAVSGYFLWGVVGFLALLSVFMGAVMFYHYRNFGFEKLKTSFLCFVYVVVCASLLVISSSFITLYLNSLP